MESKIVDTPKALVSFEDEDIADGLSSISLSSHKNEANHIVGSSREKSIRIRGKTEMRAVAALALLLVLRWGSP